MPIEKDKGILGFKNLDSEKRLSFIDKESFGKKIDAETQG